MPENHKPKRTYTFPEKVWIVCGIVALVTISILLFEATFNVIILIFAGVLIATYFRGLSTYIGKKTGWNSKLSLTASIGGTLIIFAGIVYLIGTTVSNQAAQIEEQLPLLIDDVQGYLEDSEVGREASGKLTEMQNSGDLTEYLGMLFRTTFGFLGDILIILIIGIFFTASPFLYINGIIHLVPPRKQDRAREIFTVLGKNLSKWLAGRFLAMLAVFILTSIGLVILGMPMWLTLALIAGLLNFIPNFGPIVASLPAVLIALSISPTTAALVAGLYLVVQLLESGLINPMAQKKLVKIPPALIIISQLLVGAMTGIWGVVLATPLVLVVILLVKELYVRPMNNNVKKETT